MYELGLSPNEIREMSNYKIECLKVIIREMHKEAKLGIKEGRKKW